MAQPITVPYEDYNKLMSDSNDKGNIVKILGTEFPDDTCQLIAIKSVLGLDKEEETTTPSDGGVAP